MNQTTPPASPFLAEVYLQQHGHDAPHSERARWMLSNYQCAVAASGAYHAAANWLLDPSRLRGDDGAAAEYRAACMAYDWSEVAWRRHLREQRELLDTLGAA